MYIYIYICIYIYIFIYIYIIFLYNIYQKECSLYYNAEINDKEYYFFRTHCFMRLAQ